MYGLSCHEMERLWEGMGILSRILTVWPDPVHLLAEGSKLYHEKIIAESLASLGLSCPRAVRVTPSPAIIDEITNGTTAGVLKREFSSEGKHVYTPHTEGGKDRLAAALRDERAAYNSRTNFPKPVWYIQPYIAPLLYLGEIRAFVINGVFYAAVMTSPRHARELGHMDVQEAVLFTPLAHLRYVSVLSENIDLTSDL